MTAIALVIASTAFAESADDALPAIESRIATIEGRVKAGKVSELQRTRKLHNAVLFDIRLETEMRRATELVVLSGRGFSDGGRSFFGLGVAKPSVKNPGGGFCGAGTEDALLLIEWKVRPSRLELRDSIPVRSCLHSMALTSDWGSDLRVVLRGVDHPAKVVLSWLQHPKYGAVTKTLTVSGGAFVLAP